MKNSPSVFFSAISLLVATLVLPLATSAQPHKTRPPGRATPAKPAAAAVPVLANRGITSTLAGGDSAGYRDGSGMASRFNFPNGVAADGFGNLYVADRNNHRIRKIVVATGAVTTLAGSGAEGDGDGTGAAAQFTAPNGLAIGAGGILYVADEETHCIRKIVVATGKVTRLAGNGMHGHEEGPAPTAEFSSPSGLALDSKSGILYVAEQTNHCIRKIVLATGQVSTLAGSPTSGYQDGTGAAARFLGPEGVALDGRGNLYVTEYNHRIRKVVVATGVVTTLAGSTKGYRDGPGAGAQFNHPAGIAADRQGNVYVADVNNGCIRRIVVATGAVSTLAGNGTMGTSEGTGATAQFINPYGLALDDNGVLYVVDRGGRRIRVVK